MTMLLHCENLAYGHGRQLLFQGLNLTLQAREIVALVGNNGVGKTTLLELLAGARTPEAGTVKRQTTKRFWLGYVPATAPLYPQLTVRRYLRLCAELRAVAAPTIDRVIDRCALGRVLNQRCGQLSQGYRQRLALAQALLHEPEVLLLDELSNGLDYPQKQEMLALLGELKSHCAILFISHDWAEVARLADRVYWLENQQLREIPLPQRPPHYHWLQTRNASAAARLRPLFPDATGDDDFIGFVPDPATLQTVQQHWADIVALHPHYPPVALQEKIHAARPAG